MDCMVAPTYMQMTLESSLLLCPCQNPAKPQQMWNCLVCTITPPSCEVEGTVLPQVDLLNVLDTSGTMICLTNLRLGTTSTRQDGSTGLFQGDLSPLAGRSMVDTCILPILLYSAENWYLSPRSLHMLDSFLGEISKRLLKLPQWYCNTPARIVAGQVRICWSTILRICLVRKLNYFAKVTAEVLRLWHPYLRLEKQAYDSKTYYPMGDTVEPHYLGVLIREVSLFQGWNNITLG